MSPKPTTSDEYYNMEHIYKGRSASQVVVSRKATAILILVVFCLIFLPITILSHTLDWPENLDQDAAYNLALILEHKKGVFWGYFLYLIYSIMFYPMAYLVNGLLAGTSDMNNPILHLGNGFAALSTITRCIGLCRWLFVMPVLAELYASDQSDYYYYWGGRRGLSSGSDEDGDSSDERQKEVLEIVYYTVNAWGEGIHDFLGESLFTALWVYCASLLFIRSTEWPSWMGIAGIVVAIDLGLNLMAIPVLDYDIGSNFYVSLVLLHFWLLLSALLFLRHPLVEHLQKNPDIKMGVSEQPTETDMS